MNVKMETYVEEEIQAEITSKDDKDCGYIKRKNKLGECVFFCKSCDFKTEYYFSLKDHINANHSEIKKIYRCNLCPKAFYKLKTFQTHRDKIHGLKAMQCTGQNCMYKSNEAEMMAAHYEAKHPELELPDAYQPADPNSPYVLARIRAAPGTSNVTKKVTYPKVTNKKSFKDMYRVVNGIFHCSKCEGYSCQNRSALINHLNRAHFRNEIKCTECDFKTFNECDIFTHMKKIHKFRTENCMIPDCNYRTIHPNKMQIHLLSVHNARYDEQQHAIVVIQ